MQNLLLVVFSLIGWSARDVFSAGPVSVPIQNVLQIPYALESVTGISSRETEIANFYRDHRVSYPRQGLIDEVSEVFLFSHVSYASLYCKKMIDRDMNLLPEKRWAHRNLDFASTAKSWSQETKRAQLDEYSKMFWQRPMTLEEERGLIELFSKLSDDLPNDAKGTGQILMALCSVFGASFSFLAI
ncbi:MAG: hypothetical protein AABZ55_13740 [Bdellovibrionota bacterium]